jgi:hypothetical protein
MKQRIIVLSVIVLGLALAACSAAQPFSVQTTPEVVTGSQAQVAEPASSQEMARTDTQGAVTVEVTPDNLSNPGDELVFEVSMNTHSVDLSMDLAQLAILSVDNGSYVQATLWDAPVGGHHVSGKLSFPASVDGKALLDGAARLTLTINNVDVPQRVFTWELK